MLTIEMLPAAHGDALWVEYGTPSDVRRIIVDGGPAHTYGALRSRILSLPAGRRHFELLIVTHIDTDHIDGVIRLLQDEALGATFDDVWFNGWPQIAPPDLLGVEHGEIVGMLLTERGLPWNRRFEGKAVAADGEPVELEGGLKLTVLGPGPDELGKLLTQWTDVLGALDWKPGDPERARADLERRRGLGPPPDVLGATKEDHSVANLSSIVVLAEHGTKSALLTGDAHAGPLDQALRVLNEGRGQERLAVDAFKVPHHGSAGNLTADLLDRLAARRYLISTSGAIFKHPDPPAVELLLASHHGRARPELAFNYRSPHTERWADPDLQEQSGYVASFPSGLAVEL